MHELSPKTAELVHRLESASAGLLNRLLGSDKQQIELLSEIGNSTEYAALPAVIPFAFDRNRLVAEAAVNAVNRLVSLLPTTSLTVFEETVRWVLRSSEANYRLTPNDINYLASFEKSAAGVVGLATMDYNGRVREAALRLLARISDDRETPFVLVRLNDWVEQVRLLACWILEQHMTSDCASHFVESIPLIFDLGKRSRMDHTGTVESVVALLQQPESRTALLIGTKSPNTAVRRHCLQIALDAKDVKKSDILMQAARDTEPMIRLWAARRLSDLAADEQPDLWNLLEHDRFAPVRGTVLEIQAKRSPEQARKKLFVALLDANSWVRSIAQFYLRKINAVSLPDFYLQAITKYSGKDLLGVIEGIGETGSSGDTAVVVPFTKHRNRKTRHAAIKTLARLADDAYVPLFLELLSSDNPGDSKMARNTLVRKRRDIPAEKLWGIFKSDERPHVRRNVLVVVAKLNKWISLPYLLRATYDADASVARAAHRHLRQWYKDFPKSFTRPTEQQASAIAEALEDFSAKLDPEFVREIRLTIKPFTQ